MRVFNVYLTRANNVLYIHIIHRVLNARLQHGDVTCRATRGDRCDDEPLESGDVLRIYYIIIYVLLRHSTELVKYLPFAVKINCECTAWSHRVLCVPGPEKYCIHRALRRRCAFTLYNTTIS